MAPEKETASPGAEDYGKGGSDMTINCASDTSKSITSNRGQGRGQGGCPRRGIHQGGGGLVRHFNCPAYTSSTMKFKVKMDYFGAVLGKMNDK